MPKSNRDWYQTISEEGLIPRQDWEKILAQGESQRYGLDRPERNDDPFPDASNVRDTYSNRKIEQKKAIYSQIIYSSQNLANFRALTPGNNAFAQNLASYFDQIVKERTDWEFENVFALDSGLQDGESWMKISWDADKEVPIPMWKENIMMILPGSARLAKSSPWMAEVIHLSKADAKRRFGKLPGFDQLWKYAGNDDGQNEENDLVAKIRERYLRAGINNSGRTNMLVLWELHYEDEDSGEKRMRTLSPDDPDFDFQDDREYPFWDEIKKVDPKTGEETITREKTWMYVQFRREWTTPNQHSSRGIPRLVEEVEFVLTAAARAEMNSISLSGPMVFQSANGLPPGSTNNITLESGSILPAGIQPVQWPEPVVDFEQQAQKWKQIGEETVSSADNGIGRNNDQSAPRTAKEIQLIGSIQQTAVSYELTPWKKFCRECYRQMWSRIQQFKPSTLMFFVNNTVQELPPEALDGSYQIDLSWSGDNINKEYLAQQAGQLWQATRGDPMFNQVETAKNMLDFATPGQVHRFLANQQQVSQDMGERITSELVLMTKVGYPVRPKEDVDHYQAVVMAMQFLQANQQKSQMGMEQPINPQALKLVSDYMAAHRAMLQKTNPEKYKQLNAQLSQLDHATQQQAQTSQQPVQGQLAPNQGLQNAGVAPISPQPKMQ